MIAGRHVQINWKLAVFTLLLLPVLLRLGFWQLAREDEKRALQALYEERLGGIPMSLEHVRQEDDPAFLPLAITGRYDAARSFLLDNSIHESRPGVEVITPLLLNDGEVLLVNRGWLAQGARRDDLPAIDAPVGELSLRASVYVPQGAAVTLGEEEPFSGWPRRVQTIDTSRMYDELGIAESFRALPWTVRLQQGEAGVYQRPWQAINMGPEQHRGYAVQWFSMAFALFALFIIASVPRRKKSLPDN